MQRRVLLVLIGVAAAACLVAAAGDLDPPGPPAPTMLPLDQVQPRIPIRAADLPLTISQSGSYYLAETIVTNSEGITIDADNVTIDLMGHTLFGGTGTGIRAASGTKNLVVRNGCVTDWGTHGVDLWEALHSQVIDVRAENNVGDGIRVQFGSYVVHSTAYDNGMTGIIAWHHSTILGCVARGNRWGLSLNDGSAAIDSVSGANDMHGIDANDGSQVRGCTTSGNTQNGINAGQKNLIVGNLSHANLQDGIAVSGQDNRIEGNHVADNATGMHCTGSGNLFVRNSASGNTTANFDVAGGNDVGPIGTAAAATSPWANIEF